VASPCGCLFFRQSPLQQNFFLGHPFPSLPGLQLLSEVGHFISTPPSERLTTALFWKCLRSSAFLFLSPFVFSFFGSSAYLFLCFCTALSLIQARLFLSPLDVHRLRSQPIGSFLFGPTRHRIPWRITGLGSILNSPSNLLVCFSYFVIAPW